MCHPLLLALCRPGAAARRAPRYQLNIGHLLAARPGLDDQLLHRDELVWSDLPTPHPELQLASVIAFVDFTRENGATRVVPGSHRWPERELLADRAVARRHRRHPSRSRTRRCPPARPSSTRAAPSTAAAPTPPTIAAPRRAPQLLPRLAAHRGEQLPRRRRRRSRRSCRAWRQELLGYAVHDGIPRGGGYLGMVRSQDPVELLARGELTG